MKDFHRADRLFSRRLFLRISGGALVAWLAACQTTKVGLDDGPSPPSIQEPTLVDMPPSPVPSTEPIASPTAIAPATLQPQSSPVLSIRSETDERPKRSALMAHWPDIPTSRVVVVRHNNVWEGNNPAPQVVRQMLDVGLVALTDVADPLTVWRTLFDPQEAVLLKVNCIASGGPTQPAVAYAVAQCLQDAGLIPENILIFDRTDHELERAGYTLNRDGPGVRCHGAQGVGSAAPLSQGTVHFYRELDEADAIINLPTPKQHTISGVSASMKNHYGSIDRPGVLHGNHCNPAIAELNAQSNIRSKTRLIVGAALKVSPFDWERPEPENALLLSFDPVALDTVSRDILIRHRQKVGADVEYLVSLSGYLRTAQEIGLGTTDLAHTELREIMVG